MAEQPVPGAAMGFVGRWRILEMELWDADAFDLVGPAFIEFGSDLRGRPPGERSFQQVGFAEAGSVWIPLGRRGSAC